MNSDDAERALEAKLAIRFWEGYRHSERRLLEILSVSRSHAEENIAENKLILAGLKAAGPGPDSRKDEP